MTDRILPLTYLTEQNSIFWLIEQAQNALYSVYYKIRNKKIPLNLQLKIVDAFLCLLYKFFLRI
jgi:hypothetical protein